MNYNITSETEYKLDMDLSWGSNNETGLWVQGETEVEFHTEGQTRDGIGLVDWIETMVDLMEEITRELDHLNLQKELRENLSLVHVAPTLHTWDTTNKMLLDVMKGLTEDYMMYKEKKSEAAGLKLISSVKNASNAL